MPPEGKLAPPEEPAVLVLELRSVAKLDDVLVIEEDSVWIGGTDV